MPTIEEDFGVDLSTFQGAEGSIDFDPLLPNMTGPRVALEGIARRWDTIRGSLSFAGLPNYGYSIRALCGKRMSPLAIARAQEALAQEARQEQGVLGCSVQITETAPSQYRVVGKVSFASGPYTLVAQASAQLFQLLKVSRG